MPEREKCDKIFLLPTEKVLWACKERYRELSRQEAYMTKKKTCPYAVCRIDDTDQQKQLRTEFIAAFGSFGQYLVEDLKDIDEAMNACNDFYQSYTNL